MPFKPRSPGGERASYAVTCFGRGTYLAAKWFAHGDIWGGACGVSLALTGAGLWFNQQWFGLQKGLGVVFDGPARSKRAEGLQSNCGRRRLLHPDSFPVFATLAGKDWALPKHLLTDANQIPASGVVASLCEFRISSTLL